MAEIVDLPCMTLRDLPVSRVLDSCQDLSQVLVIGRDQNGCLAASSSTAEVGYLLELVEEFKYNLISGVYGPRVQE